MAISWGILSIQTSFVCVQRKDFKGVYMNGVLGVWPNYNMEKIDKNPPLSYIKIFVSTRGTRIWQSLVVKYLEKL